MRRRRRFSKCNQQSTACKRENRRCVLHFTWNGTTKPPGQRHVIQIGKITATVAKRSKRMRRCHEINGLTTKSPCLPLTTKLVAAGRTYISAGIVPPKLPERKSVNKLVSLPLRRQKSIMCVRSSNKELVIESSRAATQVCFCPSVTTKLAAVSWAYISEATEPPKFPSR
jgi:hypothetical protein